MPILKIKREHKFGIVSLSRAKELLSKPRDGQPCKRKPRPALIPEINQDFVTKYNSKPKEDRDSLDTIIKGALQHAKYKAGLIHATHPRTTRPSKESHSAGIAGHPPLAVTYTSPAPFSDSNGHDVSYAWLQLTLLSQCDSPLQQEILLTLCKSLNHSPISISHISSLFHIAGLCYQWLKGEYLAQSLLRTGELLLLKIAYLVCLRLYYHHLSGFLVDCCTKEEIRQLRCDLEGFENKEVSYRNLPESLFYWKFSLEVGLLVCEYYHGSTSLEDLQKLSKVSFSDQTKEKETKGVQISSPGTSRTSCGGHGMCSVLWHSLDIWQCVKQGSEVLQETIQDFLSCSIDFKEDNWMEGYLAMSILCTTSELSLPVLNLVQSLAKGSRYGQELAHTENGSKLKTASQTSPPISKENVKLRFTMPNTMELGGGATMMLPSAPQEQGSSSRNMPTLNMLGMQPDFNVPDGESIYTEARIEQSPYAVTREEEYFDLDDYKLVAPKTSSADYINHMQERQPMFLHSNDTYTPDTVGTQSLIENESIPDPLPSGLNSNITVMDMIGSLATVDLGESLGKSVGQLLMSSNSKNLDISVSNLVSPCVLPSGELESIIELEVYSVAGGKEANKSVFSDKCSSATADKSGSRQDDVQAYDLLGGPNARLQLVNPPQVKVVSIPETSVERGAYSRCTNYTHSTAPLAGGANMLGSMVHPSTLIRHSSLYSTTSRTSPDLQIKAVSFPMLQPFMLSSWPIEVVLAFVMGIACCAIYGRTSLIQRTAMEGFVQESENAGKRSYSKKDSKRKECGLLDLVVFKDSETSGADCPGWFVRYMAVMGLYKVSRTCQRLSMKDDFSKVAWTKLMEQQMQERDQRVQNAFIVAQGLPDMDNSLIDLEDHHFSSPLIAHMADELSSIYLPPQATSTLTEEVPTKHKSAPSVTKRHTTKMDFEHVQARVNTRLEYSRLPKQQDIISRRIGKLNEIAKEDWKRQMENEEQEENEEKQGQEKKTELKANLKDKKSSTTKNNKRNS